MQSPNGRQRRIAILRDDPCKIDPDSNISLIPSNIPVPSFAEAIGPLMSSHGSAVMSAMTLATQIQTKWSETGNTDILNYDQIAAICLYEQEEQSVYEMVNRVLCGTTHAAASSGSGGAFSSSQRQISSSWIKYIRLLTSALFALPSLGKDAVVYKGASEDLEDMYKPLQGQIVHWPGINSGVTSLNQLNLLFGEGKRTVFVIKCHRAKEIKDYSLSGESEVLLMATSKFRVGDIEISVDDPNLYMIYLTEVEEDEVNYPMLSLFDVSASASCSSSQKRRTTANKDDAECWEDNNDDDSNNHSKKQRVSRRIARCKQTMQMLEQGIAKIKEEQEFILSDDHVRIQKEVERQFSIWRQMLFECQQSILQDIDTTIQLRAVNLMEYEAELKQNLDKLEEIISDSELDDNVQDTAVLLAESVLDRKFELLCGEASVRPKPETTTRLVLQWNTEQQTVMESNISSIQVAVQEQQVIPDASCLTKSSSIASSSSSVSASSFDPTSIYLSPVSSSSFLPPPSSSSSFTAASFVSSSSLLPVERQRAMGNALNLNSQTQPSSQSMTSSQGSSSASSRIVMQLSKDFNIQLSDDNSTPLLNKPMGVCWVESMTIGLETSDVILVAEQGKLSVVSVNSRMVVKSIGERVFKSPAGVCINVDGHILVTDIGWNKIFLLDRYNDDVIRASSSDLYLNYPRGIAVEASSQRIFVADGSNHRVVMLNQQFEILQIIGGKEGEPGHMSCPNGVAIDKSGRLFASDWSSNKIFVFEEMPVSGNRRLFSYARAFGKKGSNPGELMKPRLISIGLDDGLIVADGDNNRFQVFDNMGGYVRSERLAGKCVGVCLDKRGRIIASDWSKGNLVLFSK